MVITVLGAYPLSKKRFMGGKFIMVAVSFTMWFSAGIIPFYLTLKQLGLTDSRLGIILPFACSAFYVILLRSYFQSIHESIEESAKIDGANDFLILWRIVLPLSVPALLTIALYYAVERWNGFFWAMVLLKDDGKMPLQVMLRKLIVDMTAMNNELTGGMETRSLSKETVTYATIVVSIVPIVLVYPYIQKYFVKGIMVGAVKG
jgi:putative aldouronate transport system permease protein